MTFGHNDTHIHTEKQTDSQGERLLVMAGNDRVQSYEGIKLLKNRAFQHGPSEHYAATQDQKIWENQTHWASRTLTRLCSVVWHSTGWSNKLPDAHFFLVYVRLDSYWVKCSLIPALHFIWNILKVVLIAPLPTRWLQIDVWYNFVPCWFNNKIPTLRKSNKQILENSIGF